MRPWQLPDLIPTMLVEKWKTDYARSTAYVYRRSLLRLLDVLRQHGATVAPPPKVRPPQARAMIATGEQLARLRATAPPWLRLLLLLCSQLALRSAEAFSICPAAWNRERNQLRVQQKGGDYRTVPCTPEITALLETVPEEGDPLESCVCLLYGKHTNLKCLRQRFRALKARLGIPDDLRLHDLRRTTLTWLYHQTKDLRAVQQFAGHKSMMNTVHYLAPHDQATMTDLLARLRPPTETKQ